MEIGPIFRSMARNKIGVSLLLVEVGVTLAIVLNCAGMVFTQAKRLQRETGLDEGNIMIIQQRPFGAAYEEVSSRMQIINRDLSVIRAQPGVVSASVIEPLPLQGGGSSSITRPLGKTAKEGVRTPIYLSDIHFIETLGLELVAGRNFVPEDIPTDSGPAPINIIVTQDLADALFPNGNALGQPLNTGSEEYPDTIVGIVKHMFTPYGGSEMETRIVFFPTGNGDSGYITYLVRAEPKSYNALFTSLPDLILNQQPDRVVQTRTMHEIKIGGLLMERMMVKILLAVIVLLLFITGIGLAGMTAFAVARRTKQIGIRRALGAQKMDILRYFLLENAMVLGAGMVLGLAGGLLLNRLLVTAADVEPLPVSIITGCIATLVTFGLVATLLPALRSTRIEPAIATRTV